MKKLQRPPRTPSKQEDTVENNDKGSFEEGYQSTTHTQTHTQRFTSWVSCEVERSMRRSRKERRGGPFADAHFNTHTFPLAHTVVGLNNEAYRKEKGRRVREHS